MGKVTLDEEITTVMTGSWMKTLDVEITIVMTGSWMITLDVKITTAMTGSWMETLVVEIIIATTDSWMMEITKMGTMIGMMMTMPDRSLMITDLGPWDTGITDTDL